ncbi:large neutral amino acids transporter small subunit 1 [Bicyclus anynana]|uniref:Large neutral amino acids transporter small subunit 1 n=1 Tax=Bicyclus anynana TaxID=110368 RepID=A0ABM3M8J4_BICAN|nr:large neutral amino acids transporter small subunit 1 [Bicyclus anynana]XP_052747319.1 large neutral amino acids transporter small subunit 1 [Bicyclus anynana]XP_052747320.1 large neutral amino acids transporter small subunit 1 [Bicyclus anynana]XP_052747321.1 large neutral amino acids transporter small subunit 1 [Bicyclus anynana]XP_052747322.1 large neutral amino acids transporter small subunit 1 [Bicyclus anynana]XP_052747323.1 large neutral amino acids transporter small subunit 1 [Bicyc
MTKVSVAEGLTPKAMDVGESGVSEEGESTEGVRLNKELSLMNGVAIIVGVIVGSGIFVSPNLLLEQAGSKGMALIVWVLSGFLSMIGALCYAELGTMIPKSGGDYAYIGEAFGNLPAFLYLWVALFVLVPTGNAITAITFAQNILKPLWPACDVPKNAVSLIAAVITCFLTALNCYNVKWVTRVQDSFTAAKILALLVTFFGSLVYLFAVDMGNLKNMMEGTITDPGHIAIAFYNGLFSYSGWNYLNFVTEELKDPYKNLPRAICISMPVVTLVYALTNVAYFAVLTKPEILASEAVAVAFSDKILGVMSWIMPVFVALCTFGSLNGAIYTSSRLFFVGARNGHLPLAISLIDVKRLTPVPSLIFMCLVTLLLLLFNDVGSLMVYVSAVEAIFLFCSVAGLLWLRYKQPNKKRPIKVILLLPITFLIVCTFLIVFSCITRPVAVGAGIGFIAVGAIVYCVFFMWKHKPRWMVSFCDNFNLVCSKLFLSLPESSKEL